WGQSDNAELGLSQPEGDSRENNRFANKSPGHLYEVAAETFELDLALINRVGGMGQDGVAVSDARIGNLDIAPSAPPDSPSEPILQRHCPDLGLEANGKL
ncbi:MAG TPA: hypothetical protein VGP72_16430, partial [Planctomycetota bacterium]